MVRGRFHWTKNYATHADNQSDVTVKVETLDGRDYPNMYNNNSPLDGMHVTYGKVSVDSRILHAKTYARHTSRGRAPTQLSATPAILAGQCACDAAERARESQLCNRRQLVVSRNILSPIICALPTACEHTGLIVHRTASNTVVHQ